ncbi:MAG: restriction endonuclease subunit S [candidate division WOR-3 bacterium]
MRDMNGPYKLPEGWKWVRLGEVCEINPPRPRDFYRHPETPTTFVPMAAVDERTGTIFKAEIVPYFKVAKGYTYFEENDVLFAKITPCMQNGKHVIAKNLIDGIGFGTTEFHVLRPKKDIILSEWIWFFIRQAHFLQEATAYFTGAVGQQRIPESFLKDYLIPLPLLPEQRRIAEKLREIMSEIEKARTACKRQLEAVKALPSAYLREVFESEEAKKWEKRRLGEVLSIIESGSRPKGGVQEVKEGIISIGAEHLNSYGGFNFANVRFIPNAFYQTMKRGKIQKGDVLIVKDGATTGKTSIVDDDFPYKEASINEHVFRLRGKENLLTQQFLFWFLYSPQGQFQIQQEFHGSAQGGINQKFIYGVRIPLPPLPTQQRIANYLKEKMSEVEKLRQAVERQLETINALPQAYLRKAFRGEL